MNIQQTSRSSKKTACDTRPSCSVSVSCSSPSTSGDIAVECTYQGDALLAAYLLQRALSYLEDQIESSLSPIS